MFTKLKNIDTAFKYIRLTTLVAITSSLTLCLFVLYKSYQLAALSQNKVYVLANGKAIEAFSSDRKENLEVEAKDHIKNFHHYFFTLSPDESEIRSTISRGLYLADGSANTLYKNLQEAGYYAGVISGNISQSISIDSIDIELNSDPYVFTCWALQKLTRPTSITFRRLVTHGVLRPVSRSENNPHGFLVEKLEVLQNKDVKNLNR